MARRSDYRDSPISVLIKYFLFFTNFLIFLGSGAVLGVTIWVLVVKEKKVVDFGDFIFDLSCVLCLVAAVAVVVSFFGWFGALRENTLAIQIYLVSMSACFILQIGGIIFLFVLVYAPDVPQQIGFDQKNALSSAIVKYRDDPDMQNLIDGLQTELKCCGTTNDNEGYKDWSLNEYFNCSMQPPIGEACFVPFSCCKLADGDMINYLCGRGMQSPNVTAEERESKIYVRGCFKALYDILNGEILVVAGIVIGILVPQLFMSWLTRKLHRQIQKQKAKWYRN